MYMYVISCIDFATINKDLELEDGISGAFIGKMKRR